MPVPVIIPKATISMEEATILKWLKGEGDLVAKDEPLFEMETDKAVLEVPAPESGTLLRILVPQGSAKVEQVIGWIGQPGEPIEATASELAGAAPAPAAVSVPDDLLSTPVPLATPAARRRARELGIQLAGLAGTGPGGRITQEDIERAARSPAGPATRLLRQRRSLIQQLSATWQTVPHIHIAKLLDADGLIEAKALVGADTTITDLVLFLLAKLLPGFPGLTMTWVGDDLQPVARLDLAFAVDTDTGVVAPVIRGAESLSLHQLSQARRALAEAARSHRLRLQDLEGGVFTLTNLGTQEVDFFAPVINAPQTAILAIGRAAQQPVAVNEVLGIGWRMWANLAVDHRVTDGAEAGRFLSKLQDGIRQLPQQVRGTP